MNIEELNTQIEYLKETKNLIKEQLITKGQPVDDNTTFREYVDNMNDLVDTTDANAIEDDLALDKTAYVNGQKITGTLETTDAISIDNSNNTDTHLTLMNMGNIPSMVVSADINDLYGVRKIVEDGTSLEIIAPQSQIANVISLTADKIKAGETILGVAGSSSVVDTSDANATVNDIALNKIAYINGQKVTGTLRDIANGSASSFINTEYTIENKSQFNLLDFRLPFTEDVLHRQGSVEQLNVMYGKLNSVIGLTADKIKLGETILGITGTYAGSTMKEYASVTDMNNDIANISDGELVKVVESGTTSYFIKETISGTATMTKLVKESETMSPQEYTDANDIADEVLGN